MDQQIYTLLFALIRSAVSGEKLEEKYVKQYSHELFDPLYKLASKHDVAHLFILGLKNNALIAEDDLRLEKVIFTAVYRYEKLQFELEALCQALEEARLCFIPLKGAIIRGYYPEPWMRTSCDIDVLVKKEELENAINALCMSLGYEKTGRSTHDVSLSSPSGVRIELHFDLVEEDCANNAIKVLRSVWDMSEPEEGCTYRHKMNSGFFYFYHIAHMAKHFENGGCGIRPFIDLWLLEKHAKTNAEKKDELLCESGLDKFAHSAVELSLVWFEGKEPDPLSIQMQDFLLSGGVYGTTKNRVTLQQNKKGGKAGYLISRIFAPKEKLVRYYPVLEKHPWLLPFMQVRRWFMLLNPKVAKMAKSELNANKSLDGEKAKDMKRFLNEVGLQ